MFRMSISSLSTPNPEPRCIQGWQKKQRKKSCRDLATHHRYRHCPRKIGRDSGIIGGAAAAAVRQIGRTRRTMDSMMASHYDGPRARSCSDWEL
jgi:hypothetical protein